MSTSQEELDLLFDKTPSKVALVLALLSGLTLTVIGLRFLFDPLNAATFFGVLRDDPGFGLHYAVAFRDVWLGLIAVAFALLKDWRALTIWLGFGALVCFADAWIAATSSVRWVSIMFHMASGLFCGALARICWLHHKRMRSHDDEGMSEGPDGLPRDVC